MVLSFRTVAMGRRRGKKDWVSHSVSEWRLGWKQDQNYSVIELWVLCNCFSLKVALSSHKTGFLTVLNVWGCCKREIWAATNQSFRKTWSRPSSNIFFSSSVSSLYQMAFIAFMYASHIIPTSVQCHSFAFWWKTQHRKSYLHMETPWLKGVPYP